MLDMISIYLNLLRFDLWPKMWSILENVPCALEKVYSFAFGWNVLKITMRSISSNVSFKTCVSLLIFCFDDLSIGVNVCESLLLLLCYCQFLLLCLAAAAAAKSLQLCPTLCDPIDGSPPGTPVPGILQARILEWVAISFSKVWTMTSTVSPMPHSLFSSWAFSL